MQKFTTLSGVAAPLPVANIDTDQIIPKQFLSTVERAGLARGLFFDMRVAPDGSQTLWLQDADPQHLAWVERAYEAGTMDRPHLDGIKSRVLRNTSSIAFSGADRRTAVLGCLLGDSLATLVLPVPGVAPIHWNYA